MKPIKKYFMTAFALATATACGTIDTANDSELKARASNYLKCNSDKSECKLTKNLVKGAPGIIADYAVSYTMPCWMDGAVPKSTIFVESGNSRQSLKFGTKVKKTVTVTGSRDLTVVDDDANYTAGWFFDLNTPCNLMMSVTVTPSVSQIMLWDKDTDSIIDKLNFDRELYKAKADIKMWYDVWIDNPTPSVQSVLEQNIESLRASGKERDKVKANSLQGIIDNMDSAKIFKPYDDAKKRILEKTIPSTNNHIALLKKWNQAITDRLTAALSDAKDAVDEI